MGLAVVNGYAYIADGASGLQIIDIEPVESANIIKTVDTPILPEMYVSQVIMLTLLIEIPDL